DYDQFKITVPENAKYTGPYFTRRDPETETVYKISDPTLLTQPWPAYPVHVTATFNVLKPVIDTPREDALRTKSGEQPGGAGEISAVAKIKFIDPTLGQSERPLAVGPPISVLLTSPIVVAPVGGAGKSQIGVSVRSNVQTAVHAKLTLETPPGWKVEPAEIVVDLDHD